MTVIDQMTQRLTEVFAPIELRIVDTSAAHAGHHHRHTTDASGHFDLRIVSAAFAGMTPVARHRAIYMALQPLMDANIHALAIDARAPGEVDRGCTAG